MNELIDFVKEREGTISSKIEIDCHDIASGNGIFAKESIEKGETLMSVPFNICISTESIIADSKLGVIFEDLPGLLDYQDEVLAIGIMYAKSNGKDSIWSKHLNTIPDKFNTTLYWEDLEIEELRPTSVYHLTKMLQNQIKTDWNQIHSDLKENYPQLLGNISFELYKWSLSVIYSRAVGIKRNGKYTRIVPPILDMANHAPVEGAIAGDCFHYNEELDTLSLISAQDINVANAGTNEIFISYGSYPNSKLAYSYGFVIPHENPNHAIDLWTKVSQNTIAGAYKQKLLQSSPLTRYQAYDFNGTIRENWISPALLITIRVIQATEEELPKLPDTFQGKMVSVRNELSTYNALKELMLLRVKTEKVASDRLELGSLLLNFKPTIDNESNTQTKSTESVFKSVEEHNSDIENEEKSYRKLMALVIRVEEQDLLLVSYGHVGVVI